MFAFIVKLVLGVVLFSFARYLFGRAKEPTGRRDEGAITPLLAGLLGKVGVSLSVAMIFWAIIGTSMIWVPSGKIATFKRIYFASPLPTGKIVALDNQLGPQARIMTAGFHFEPFVTLLNEVEDVPVFSVPNGQCAIISARDGVILPGNPAFPPPWSDETKLKMINDAEYFLTEGKGVRGPQTTVLTPGSYNINPFLWEAPKLVAAQRVEQGTVAVVKSSVRAAVDFGPFRRPLSVDGKLKVLTLERLQKDSANVLLVPVGEIGVWEEPLPNGLYYINTDAYKVTMVPTVAQVHEYKGGYKKRSVEISLSDKGTITERVSEVDVQPANAKSDTAIFTKPEGWDVPQEVRVIVQVSPEMAPFVVASLGLTEANATHVIEDRVVTPIVRSVVRDVLGGAQILFKQMRAILDDKGMPVIGADGNPKTEMHQEFRAVKVMDLLEQRASLEEAIDSRVRPEALKEGVTVNEVRLSESAIPAELLIARKREQLAQQLTKAWTAEQTAQAQRQLTENARSQAEQQGELVKADIAAQAAKQRANARTIEADGEKAYLLAVAEGQKAQSLVLGPETTAKLQMFQQLLKAGMELVEKNPEMIKAGLESAHKFVPTVMVNSSGQGSGNMEGAAAVFGHLLTTGGAQPFKPVSTQAVTTK
ncbi:MAG: hypothetical protein RLZZ347_80 [Candidatus Parcubacteria bacterium]|jgi:regulator of protease activity HflC (stomatin/prohibitin superfamily)